MHELITQLRNEYEKSPLIRGLIELIPYVGMADAVISTHLANLKAKKLKVFFDQLSQGNLDLTPEIIASDDFLNAYFSTVEYVFRSRSELKFRAFAEILKSFCSSRISIDEHEDYTKIFDELTEREFLILSIKYNYEVQYKDEETDNPLKRAFLYWEDFKNRSISMLNVTDQELNALLIRIQRTGCYVKYNGYFDSSRDQVGDTSELFVKLKQIISIPDN